jgi:hypothetical protein
MVRFSLAVFLGALLSFMVAFGACMFFPWQTAVVQSMPDDEVVAKAMTDHIPASGVYLFPAISKPGTRPSMEDMMAWDEKAKKGPTGIVYFARDGVDTDGPSAPVKAFGLHLLAALLAAVMLALAAPSLKSYFARVLFVTMLGVFATVTVFGMVWAVGMAPLTCFLAHLANNSIEWLAAGLVMAALIRPKLAPSTEPTS